MSRACQIVFVCFCALFAAPRASAQIPFYTAVDLALRNSPLVRAGAADVQRAEAGVMESVDAYKPSFLLGSSVGFSYGFPLGQPEIFSLTAQSLVFSFSQHDYIRSARAALEAAQLRFKDARQQTILDASLNYIELAKVIRQTMALDEENGDVQRLIEIEDKRVDAGLDSEVELTRTRLLAAQVELKGIHLRNQAGVLRARLAHLTGLVPADLTPDAQTIPKAPEIRLDGSIGNAAIDANSGVKSAYAAAKSKLYTAFGDSRQNNRPTVSFLANYGLFSDFNNYSEYYLHFQNNNFGIGLQIEIPLFDGARRAKARGSSAEAAYAAAQADQLRDQTGEQSLQLETSLAELAAQEKVAELENELSEDQLDTVTSELQSGNGDPNQPPITPKDQQQARIDERSRYVDLLDAQFQLTQAKLNLSRNVGQIEDWAKAAAHTKP